jgi:hypothetical protein
MARPMHRHRHIRLTSTRALNNQNRVDNAPRKRAERQRRDERIIAKIKAAKGKDFSAEVKSWITARTGKLWRQVTDADIQSAIAE